jgi:hypothetical protein
MIKIRMRCVLMLALIVVIAGCSHDDEKPKGKYEHGAFIVNEGGFGSSNGSVTFYNTTTDEIEQSIVTSSSTAFAGDVVQSMSFKDDRGYVVLNGDNKILVVDANTFENLSTIASNDIVAPRYVEVINDKAYISVWGPYDGNFSLIDSYVLVYDLKTNTVIKKIHTDEGTENLLYNGNYLFATNYNYGGSNTLAVINPTDNTLVKQVTLSYGPSGMTLDANGKLWVICSDFASGKLYRINPSTLAIEVTMNIANSPQTDLAITADKQNILYAIGKSIYKLPITNTLLPAQPLLTASDVKTFYGFNVNPDNDDIWIGDAMSFTATGKTYIYTSAGAAKTSFGVGLNPGQFVFK